MPSCRNQIFNVGPAVAVRRRRVSSQAPEDNGVYPCEISTVRETSRSPLPTMCSQVCGATAMDASPYNARAAMCVFRRPSRGIAVAVGVRQ